MLDVNDISGWTSGGAVTGRGKTVLGKNEDGNAVMYIKTIGPSTHTSTSYTVAVSGRGDDRKIIEQGIRDKTEAKIRAAEFMKNHPVVHVKKGGGLSAKLVDENGDRIRT